MVTISDFFLMRLELISVFLLGMVISTVVVQKVWNNFQTDFTSLPQLSFGKSFALVTLWGLLFVIVLTMISGARELMTPGAWIKKGNTYVLRESFTDTDVDEATRQLRERRKSHLQFIHTILLDDVLKRETLPKSKEDLPLPKRLWIVIETHGLEYVYVPGLASVADSNALIAEPEFFEDGRYVLWQDGRIELILPGDPMPFGFSDGEK